MVGPRFKVLEKINRADKVIRFNAFDLAQDPAETAPISSSPELEAMRDQLDDFYENLPGKIEIEQVGKIDPVMLQHFKDMGYLK